MKTTELPSIPLLLTIDDEEPMRDIVSEVARMAGFSALGVCGKRSITQALSRNPAVVVLDLTMPEMDGIEVIWEMVRIKSRAALILLSGFDATVLKAAQAIAVHSKLKLIACLTKPVDIGTLKEMLIAIDRNE